MAMNWKKKSKENMTNENANETPVNSNDQEQHDLPEVPVDDALITPVFAFVIFALLPLLNIPVASA